MKYFKSNKLQLAKKIKKPVGTGIFITSMLGDGDTNSPCCHARVLIRANDRDTVYPRIKKVVSSFNEEHCATENSKFYGCEPVCKGIGKSLEISCRTPIKAFDAYPDINAIYLLFHILNSIPFTEDDDREFIDFFNKYISPDSGLTVYQVRWTSELIMLYTSIASSGSMDAEAVYTSMLPILNKYGIGIIFHSD